MSTLGETARDIEFTLEYARDCAMYAANGLSEAEYIQTRRIDVGLAHLSYPDNVILTRTCENAVLPRGTPKPGEVGSDT